jgi:plastocyanin
MASWNLNKFKPLRHNLGEVGGSHDRHNPAVFWVLIVVVLLMLGVSVKMFSKPLDPVSNIPTTTPEDIREPRIYTVSYKGGVFSPTNLRIHSGDTVRFKNDSFFGIRIVSDPLPVGSAFSGFDSIGDVPQGSYFSYTLSEKGIFSYHNYDKVQEQGTIIVR